MVKIVRHIQPVTSFEICETEFYLTTIIIWEPLYGYHGQHLSHCVIHALSSSFTDKTVPGSNFATSKDSD